MKNEHLIVGYLTGSLSTTETKQFNDLLVSDSVFKEEFQRYQEIWLSSEQVSYPKISEFNVEANWSEFTKLTETRTNKTKIIKPNFYRAFYRVAAVVLLVISSLFVYKQFDTQGFESGIVYTNQNQTTMQGLDDGSLVYLSDHSKLNVDEQFNREDRKLRLDGKAFFVVKPDIDRVFEVVTDHLTATVKGTTFLVRTDDHSTSVGVNTGIVEVHVGNQTVTLMAGEQLDFSYINGGVVSRSNFKSSEVNAMKMQTSDYYDTPLKVILEELKRYKGIHIKAPKSIENQRFTLQLSKLPNEQIVHTIETLTHTKATQEGEIYILK